MKSRKRDNSSLIAKIMIRNRYLKLNEENRVLDLYQGVDRKMYEACYQNNKHVVAYRGYDIKAINVADRMDNRTAIFLEDLDQYNFFDLDAYGSPWELFLNIMVRLKQPGIKTFIVTDGLFLENRFGGGTKLQHAILKIPRRMRIPCLHRHHTFFLSRLFSQIEDMTGYKAQHARRAITGNIRVKYIGFQMKKES